MEVFPTIVHVLFIIMFISDFFKKQQPQLLWTELSWKNNKNKIKTNLIIRPPFHFLSRTFTTTTTKTIALTIVITNSFFLFKAPLWQLWCSWCIFYISIPVKQFFDILLLVNARWPALDTMKTNSWILLSEPVCSFLFAIIHTWNTTFSGYFLEKVIYL